MQPSGRTFFHPPSGRRRLAALGPLAKDAVPEIQSHLGMGETKTEATKAYKAVTGQEPPAGK